MDFYTKLIYFSTIIMYLAIIVILLMENKPFRMGFCTQDGKYQSFGYASLFHVMRSSLVLMLVGVGYVLIYYGTEYFN